MTPWAWGASLYGLTTLFSMAIMSIGAAILITLMLVRWKGPIGLWTSARTEVHLPASRLYFRVACTLFGALLLSLIAAIIWPPGYAGQFVEIHFLKDLAKAWYLFWPLVLAAFLRVLSEREQRNILRAWMVFFTLLSILGVLQYFFGWPRPQVIPGNEPRFHTTLFLGHHLSVASILIFPWFATLDLVRQRNGPTSIGLPRWFLIVGAVFGLLALFTTYSRITWVAVPVGLLVWVIWALPKKWSIVVSAIVGVAFFLASQTDIVKRRIYNPQGISTRQALWDANFEFFKSRPFTGAGWHHNQELSYYYFVQIQHPKEMMFIGHAHNNFLDLLGGTGLIGTLAWLAWNIALIWILLQLARRRDLPLQFTRGLVCAWIVFHIQGLTQVNFWEAKVLHQMMWVTAWALVWSGARKPT